MLNGHGKGDLYVEVRIQTPGKLNKRQRELLAELGLPSPVDTSITPDAAGTCQGYVCLGKFSVLSSCKNRRIIASLFILIDLLSLRTEN